MVWGKFAPGRRGIQRGVNGVGKVCAWMQRDTARCEWCGESLRLDAEGYSEVCMCQKVWTWTRRDTARCEWSEVLWGCVGRVKA